MSVISAYYVVLIASEWLEGQEFSFEEISKW